MKSDETLFLASLSKRQRFEEWMDSPDIDPQFIRRSLRFIRVVNSLLGYTCATLSHLKRFSQSWKPGQTITILDVATGSADIPVAISRWARKKGLNVRIVGLDRHALTASNAQTIAGSDSAIQILRADALELPFVDGSFDYVITNMFLHHLDESAVVRVFSEMNRVSRRGVIAADLIRDRRAYLWVNLFTLLANKRLRHDACVSVRQAFNREEILSLRDQAGIRYSTYFEHFGHRFVLAGEKWK